MFGQPPNSFLIAGETVFFDPDDYATISRFRWYLHKNGSTTYAQTSSNGAQFQMQVLLIPRVPPNHVRDHINRNGLDNRRLNLRVVTKGNNLMNSDFYDKLGSDVGISRDLRRKQPYKVNVQREGVTKVKCGIASLIEARIHKAVILGSLDCL